MSLLMEYPRIFDLGDIRIDMVSDYSTAFAVTDSCELHVGAGRRISLFSPDNSLRICSEGLVWPTDGVIFDNGGLRVTARHNGHMGETSQPYHSFSFLIEAEGRKAVYSGDVKDISELDGWLDCDLLMMETGHHDPIAVARYLKSLSVGPKRLLYVHHGRTMLADPAGCEAQARAILGIPTDVAYDGMAVAL